MILQVLEYGWLGEEAEAQASQLQWETSLRSSKGSKANLLLFESSAQINLRYLIIPAAILDSFNRTDIIV